VDRRKPRVRTEANESPAPDVISPPEKGARNQALPTKEAGMERASDLRVQNDLYARAYDEQKLGHTTSALALYEQLISQFPNSALIESAYAQRLRLLKQTSNGNRAKVEAQHYLDRFPAGFARTDARSILSSP
jgi:outer membrane protein assembly factor BamD (BamD/ComL family)